MFTYLPNFVGLRVLGINNVQLDDDIQQRNMLKHILNNVRTDQITLKNI